MLLNPSYKYISFILYSKHYLNDPKFLFNEAVNALVRGYDFDKACDNLRAFFKQVNYPLKDVTKIVEYHKSISITELMKINVNTYLDNPPNAVIARDNQITAWYKNNTPVPTIWNRYPSPPNCPLFNNCFGS